MTGSRPVLESDSNLETERKVSACAAVAVMSGDIGDVTPLVAVPCTRTVLSDEKSLLTLSGDKIPEDDKDGIGELVSSNDCSPTGMYPAEFLRSWSSAHQHMPEGQSGYHDAATCSKGRLFRSSNELTTQHTGSSFRPQNGLTDRIRIVRR